MFYYPDGSLIEGENVKEKFIRFYNKCYYINNSVFAEKQIEKLLEPSHILEEQDVMLILRWKFNRIDHKRCTQSNIVYKKKDYKDLTSKELHEFKTWTGRGLEINAKNICRLISDKFKNVNEDYTEVYNTLAGQPERDVVNLGPVYLLTLTSFISKGKNPIYDIQALKALKAIYQDDVPFGGTVSVGKRIQDLGKKRTESVLKLYKEYIESLEKAFGTEYQNNRNIDRAL